MGTRISEQRKADLLYPLLIVAALAVIAFGVMGVVAMSSVLPQNEPLTERHVPQTSAPPPPAAAAEPARAPTAPPPRPAKSGASSDNARSRVLSPATAIL